jgi:hypothetical protein
MWHKCVSNTVGVPLPLPRTRQILNRKRKIAGPIQLKTYVNFKVGDSVFALDMSMSGDVLLLLSDGPALIPRVHFDRMFTLTGVKL